MRLSSSCGLHGDDTEQERYPFGRCGSASAVWALARRSAAAAWVAGRGVRGSAGLQAADGDDLLCTLRSWRKGERMYAC